MGCNASNVFCFCFFLDVLGESGLLDRLRDEERGETKEALVPLLVVVGKDIDDEVDDDEVEVDDDEVEVDDDEVEVDEVDEGEKREEVVVYSVDVMTASHEFACDASSISISNRRRIQK